jgi:NAD(P)-dependent dehydrogenase (short-subunit alcohol dehydrogenase family)
MSSTTSAPTTTRLRHDIDRKRVPHQYPVPPNDGVVADGSPHPSESQQFASSTAEAVAEPGRQVKTVTSNPTDPPSAQSTDRAPVVVVSGCSSGMGRAVADRLSASCAVYGGSRRRCEPATWTYHPLDVTDPGSVSEFVEHVLAREGHIDTLVASAGVGLAGAVEDTADDEALRQFDVNVLGCHRLIRAVLPSMRGRRSGKIIVVGSIGGVIGLPFASFYSASKFALAGFVEALRAEIGPFGVQATIVHPGDLKTEFGRHRLVARGARSSSSYKETFERAVRFYADQEAVTRGACRDHRAPPRTPPVARASHPREVVGTARCTR